MLVFIDESGDPGLKTDQGSSQYFTIGLVVFEDHDEAQACDDRITLLKREISWSKSSEFHFKTNSNRVRRAFLEAVAPYNFFYYGIVIDKDPKKLDRDLFKNKLAFYRSVSGKKQDVEALRKIIAHREIGLAKIKLPALSLNGNAVMNTTVQASSYSKRIIRKAEVCSNTLPRSTCRACWPVYGMIGA